MNSKSIMTNTDYTFPEAQPIDWDTLEDGDEVWVKTTAVGMVEDGMKLASASGYALAYQHSQISGHVIKARKPLAVGDPVKLSTMCTMPRFGWTIKGLDGEMAWLYSPENGHATVRISNLERTRS